MVSAALVAPREGLPLVAWDADGLDHIWHCVVGSSDEYDLLDSNANIGAASNGRWVISDIVVRQLPLRKVVSPFESIRNRHHSRHAHARAIGGHM